VAETTDKQARLLIAAGGTGGHVFPGLAIADYAQQQGIAVEWLGGEKGLEHKLVSGRYPLHTLPMLAFRGGGVLRKLSAVVGLARAFFQARQLLRQRHAVVVLVMGGYISAPVGLAAKSLGIPVVIHEQNAIVGMANKWLSRFAARVFEAFPGTFAASPKVTHSGNPLRSAFYQTMPREASEQLRILVIGGSQGARAINQAVAGAVELLPMDKVSWWHQTGVREFEAYQDRYAPYAHVRCEAFIEDTAAAMAWADVVISRAGALSVSEIAASGRAAIFIPYPHAVDDHQYHNAKYLAGLSAAVILRQAEATTSRLVETIEPWLVSSDPLVAMGEKARSLAMPQATRLVGDACIQLGQFMREFEFLKKQGIRSIHCVGLGGIGVSGLAAILVQSGYTVTGCDSKHSPTIDYLQSIGVQLVDDSVAQVGKTDCVIYSRAVRSDRADMQAAKQRGIPLYSRGEFLAQLVQGQRNLIVAGSHGKSTTSGWAAHTLRQAGVSANSYLGAVIQGAETSVCLQDPAAPWVMESDESDASCFLLSPSCLVITNIDADHLETYNGSLAVLQDRMVQWVNAMDESGVAIVCLDDPGIQAIFPRLQRRVISYGFSEGADYQLLSCQQQGLFSQLRWRLPSGETLQAQARLPGKHNALNGLAAWIACHEFSQLPVEELTAAWSAYPGVKRRMSIHGEIAVTDGEAMIIEDYGHHPREVQATLDALKSAWPQKRVVMLFQPHRYTRTRDLFAEFVGVLKEVDQLCLLPIYAAGEQQDHGMSTVKLAAAVADGGVAPTVYHDLEEAQQALQALLQANDILLLQGAGSVGSLAQKLCQQNA
jgi:UDP-N-acetylmuramate--alanine ligase